MNIYLVPTVQPDGGHTDEGYSYDYHRDFFITASSAQSAADAVKKAYPQFRVKKPKLLGPA